MNRWILLLRGVTPTGKGRVPMALWREELGKAGFRNARTWIQSGNGLVDTSLPREEAGALTHQVLKEKLGADLAVIVKSAEEIRDVLEGSPFPGLPPERVFYGLFNDKPEEGNKEALLALDFGEDRLNITGQAVYCYIPGSAARTKLNNAWLQKKLGVDLTFRNANTLNKLVELAVE